MMEPTREVYIHESAYADEGCVIGEGTKIWHFAHIMKGAVVGKNCNIGQNVFVASTAIVGNNVKIQNNVSVYDKVTLEDDVFCGPSMVFTNVSIPRSHISRKHEYESTTVKRGATIGANATIICGITIGEYAFIAAGTVVTKDVPAHGFVLGVPAKQRGWRCTCGLRLEAVKQHLTCSLCKKVYELTECGLEEKSE